MNAATRSGGLKPPTRKKGGFKPPLLGLLATLCVLRASTSLGEPILVGSKKFTESYVLAEIAKRAVEDSGIPAEHRQGMGGTIILWEALRTDQIAFYPEYTGTSFTTILHHPPISDPRAVYDQVKREYGEQFDVEVSPPLGFDNTFAMLVRGEDARRLNLKTISEAVRYASQWRAGFGEDFKTRADGYPGFSRAYDLRFAEEPRQMALDLTYTALASRQVDMIAGNSTDGRIAALDLVQLEDDRHYFPPYEGVLLARRDALKRSPELAEIIKKLGGAISTEEMRRLNYEVDGRKRDSKTVVREWLKTKGLIN